MKALSQELHDKCERIQMANAALFPRTGYYYMSASVRAEHGTEQALEGLAYNKKQTKDMHPVADKLAILDGGHNKFLQQVFIWVSVKAPRYWWQEADTYRLTTKQSESTMHTLIRELEQGVDINEFEAGSITQEQQEAIEKALLIQDQTVRLVTIKKLLPEGFLQRRMWCLNYANLRNIYRQRITHRLPHWPSFLYQVLLQIENPEWVVG